MAEITVEQAKKWNNELWVLNNHIGRLQNEIQIILQGMNTDINEVKRRK